MIDIATITAVLGAASAGASATGQAVDVVGKLKNLVGSKDDSEAKALAGELADQLYQVRIANLEVVTQLQDLQRQAEKEDEFKQTRALYAPFKLPQGGKVLKLKQGVDDASEHWELICPICAVNNQKIVPLQGSSDHFDLKCANCNSVFPNVTWDTAEVY
ncbi:hypothetical protein [Thalassovita gelatinovora]|uniref:hypothetical protein n=1 Tax=Thalassovita gelatinovora TaxID=53501 RepID=UPI00071E51A4|nr:hypothetical protein [Thalassovita gelatinovora]QIZ81571.1 hypothetical protein HFZ77_14335 [Thalassovita gelatinovora]